MLLLASSREVLHGRGVARGGHGGAFTRPSLIFAPPSRFIYLKYIRNVAIVKTTFLLLLKCTERSGISSVVTLVTSRVTKVRSFTRVI